MRSIISQPRYLPALNYLQRLYHADIFVILDDVQRQARGFENRNKILTSHKEKWVTIPISSSSREILSSTLIANSDWIEQHKKMICDAYCKHPFYAESVVDYLYRDILVGAGNNMLFVDTTVDMLTKICLFFGFQPRIVRASSLNIDHSLAGPQHLLDICKAVGADLYISGPNGREYGVSDVFQRQLPTAYHMFSYPTYQQNMGDSFVSWLAFLDPLFNMGKGYVQDIISKPLELVE